MRLRRFAILSTHSDFNVLPIEQRRAIFCQLIAALRVATTAVVEAAQRCHADLSATNQLQATAAVLTASKGEAGGGVNSVVLQNSLKLRKTHLERFVADRHSKQLFELVQMVRQRPRPNQITH
eukprot:6208154-Pleurochrysis_carterae.AAC.1